MNTPTPLLGGLSPAQFMRRHWQKKPLLVRQALPGVQPPLGRAALFKLAERDGVESRLIVHDAVAAAPVTDPRAWRVRHGPLARRALPPVAQAGWTLLVQGLDLHVPAAHALLQPFRFLPDARLDDLMISWASPGGGVGPHLDSYDVFLLQVQGRRRWRIGPVKGAAAAAWVDGAPLKILQRFEPTEEWLLEPGDMLYLPPRWAHDGVADGECMTCSIGFRAPEQTALGAELLQRVAEAAVDEAEDAAPAAARAGRVLYRDPDQPATDTPARVPAALQAYAQGAVQRLLSEPQAIDRALGEVLTEPKPSVWFVGRAGQGDPDHLHDRDPGDHNDAGCVLDAATRMLYDEHCVYINGESYRAGGRDAVLMRRLADQRRLSSAERVRLSAEARVLLGDWQASGWVHAQAIDDAPGPAAPTPAAPGRARPASPRSAR